MRKWRLLLVGVLVAALWPMAVCGRDIYVDNTAGEDTFTGQNPDRLVGSAGPVQTIGRALRLAKAGDMIVLAKTDRPYRESIALAGARHSGTAYEPFVIKGNGATLDGSRPVPPDAWEHVRGPIFRFQPRELGHQQLFLDGRPAPRVAVGHLAGAPPELQPRQWCEMGGQIYFCVDEDKLPEDYNLTYAFLQTGITLYHVVNVGIVDLTIQGYRLDGIQAANSAREVRIAGVTCRGNGRAGIVVGGASTVDIDASLLGNNGDAQLLTLPHSETHVRNSRLLSGTAPGWVVRGGRVYVDGKRVKGGLDELKAGGSADQQPADSAPEQKGGTP